MSIRIINGIQLPAFDVELLTLGKLIAVPFIQSLREGKAFWLYSSHQLPFDLSPEQYYQPEYLTNAKNSLARCATHPIQIKAWVRCERHWRINHAQKHILPKIVKSTVWNLGALEHIFEQHQVIKLLILRVYRLSNPCIVNVPTQPGAFYWPDAEDCLVMGSESDPPVVSEFSFNKRKALLLSGEVYPHTDLEALQLQVEQLASNNPATSHLNQDIKRFLGWTSDPPAKQPDSDVAWIYTINALGTATTGGNFEKGTAFEQIVHKSLAFLGFGVDPNAKGGAGGMDLYCTTPYPLVGECKAGQSIPGNTVYELDKLGSIHLGKKLFDTAVKLIIGPGNPTPQLQKSAQEYSISIIHPMTLQKLVELQAKYPGSVNLIELKPYLEAGQIDYRIDEYISKVHKEIKLRSHLVELVKKHLENTGDRDVGVDTLHGAFVYSNPPALLKREEMHDILIELSSPLTGYLGRIRGSDWTSDRFYFLRDLPIS